jgi:hypothetical protein
MVMQPGEPKGLTRNQILQYLQRKAEMQEAAQRPLVATELYDPTKLSLVTENPPHMVMAKVRLRLVLAAMDTTRKEPLINCFLRFYNEEMISYKRQGRQEYLGALQALAESTSPGGEPTVNLR